MFKPPEDFNALKSWASDKHQAIKDFHRGRNEAWAEDRRILTQQYRRPTPDFPTVMSPEPWNNYRLALDITTTKVPRIQAVIDYQEADEQDRINKAERFAKGIYWEIERRWTRRGNRSWIRDLMGFGFMGGYAVFPLYSRTDGQHVFTAQLIDPIEVFPEWDEMGLVWVSREYRQFGHAIYTMAERFAGNESWDLTVAEQYRNSDREYEIQNIFWLQEDGVVNAVMVNGNFLKRPSIDKQFGMTIPIQVGPSNGMPFFDVGSLMDVGSGIQLTEAGHSYSSWAWQSMLAGVRQTYKDFDNLLAMERKIVEDHALPKYIETTRTGMPKFTQQQWRRGEKFPMQVGEGITPVPAPTSPRERAELLGYYSGAIQRATFAHVAFGSLGGTEISGVTLDSLINATQGFVAPYVVSGQRFIENTILSLIDQWKNSSGSRSTITLDSPADSVSDRWFYDSFTKQDIPNTMRLRVGFQLSLPDTLQSRILAARSAIGDNRPLMSVANIHENLLEDIVPDSTLERDRMDKDELHVSQQGQALRTINALEQVIQDAQARGDQAVLQAASVILQQTVSVFQQQAAGAEQRAAGVQAQRQAQGPSIQEPPPNVAPPEATGAPPDAIAGNSALGMLARRGQRVNG